MFQTVLAGNSFMVCFNSLKSFIRKHFVKLPTIFIAIGTNLGNRLDNLHRATDMLPPAVSVESLSPVYETPPWGITDQPAFLNQVIQAKTELSPHKLLGFLKQIEATLGRVKTVRNGPRIIDLDILFFDDLVFTADELTIPHPGLHERAFVLVPLADLAPDLCHPVLGKTVRQLLTQVDASGIDLYQEALSSESVNESDH